MILTVGIKQKIFLDRSPPIFFTVVCLCATKNRHNYLKFCAFAKKNAVSLTNQGCKGCQNEALCQGCKGCQNEALCLCTALEKALCTQPFRKKGARTSQKQRKTSNRPIPSGSGPVNCFVIYCISSLSRSRYGPQTLKRPRQNNLFLPEYPY